MRARRSPGCSSRRRGGRRAPPRRASRAAPSWRRRSSRDVDQQHRGDDARRSPTVDGRASADAPATAHRGEHAQRRRSASVLPARDRSTSEPARERAAPDQRQRAPAIRQRLRRRASRRCELRRSHRHPPVVGPPLDAARAAARAPRSSAHSCAPHADACRLGRAQRAAADRRAAARGRDASTPSALARLAATRRRRRPPARAVVEAGARCRRSWRARRAPARACACRRARAPSARSRPPAPASAPRLRRSRRRPTSAAVVAGEPVERVDQQHRKRDAQRQVGAAAASKPSATVLRAVALARGDDRLRAATTRPRRRPAASAKREARAMFRSLSVTQRISGCSPPSR